MRYGRKRRFTTGRVLGLLLVVSVVGLLLPTRITGRLMNLVQVLAPLQDAATRAADGAGQIIGSGDEPVPAEEYDRVVREAEGLRNTVASMSLQVAALEEANRQLTSLREGGLGQHGVLIPARVVAEDLLAWRESRLIDAGTLRGVQRGAPVTTRCFSVDAGRETGVQNGMAVLAGEALIGWVDQAGTHTARVRLVADPASRMSVMVGHFEDGVFVTAPADAPAEFWLTGTTSGGMQIIDVDHRYVEGDDGIRPGDRVMTLPDDPRLPVSLTIGTITEATPNPKNQLLYTLSVESAAPERLTQLYVLKVGSD
jgi:cell shape-determining protein MreC